MAPRNLINVEAASVSFGHEPVLLEVSLGVAAGDRIGIVGRNGGGKSTLLSVIGGAIQPDSGRVSVTSGTSVGFLSQRPTSDPEATVRQTVVGDAADHEWASDATTRQVTAALLGITSADDPVWERRVATLSGGERRRVELAALLLADPDVLLLDEPTNHLDVEAVAWLAEFLGRRRSMALLVVTHDRWFLDAVTDRTWEVVGGQVAEYDGGYSAFVLAKAERTRQADAAQARRRNLLRKELAWLRRGPPARTSKPKFRIDAANALIENEPPPRDSTQLLRFAGSRLGRSVVDLHDVTVRRGERAVLEDLTWGLGPGDRVAILGGNGAGKSTLAAVVAGQLPTDGGRVRIGTTVQAALLSQQLDELNPQWRLLEAVEDVARHVELADGSTLSASQLAERLGFGADRQWTPVGDLSGGERRRLQLTRLLMGEPNVLILDEPTNDFDVETLTALEDLLDSFAGTLVVISHDRYFLERVCDTYAALLGDGGLRDLPGGVEEYLDLRAASSRRTAAAGEGQKVTTRSASHHGADREVDARGRAQGNPTAVMAIGDGDGVGEVAPATTDVGGSSPATPTPSQLREWRKELARIDRTLAKLRDTEARLHQEIASDPTNHESVAAANAELQQCTRAIAEAEERWLEIAEMVE